MTKAAACGYLWLCLTYGCFGQTQEALCPKHIEIPAYPPIARSANITGKVVLGLTIDAEGKVSDVKVMNGDDKWVAILKSAATNNVHLWTFAKPTVVPYMQTIVYDFELDPSLPGDDGNHSIAKVSFDLPDRVTIAANLRLVDHGPGYSGTSIKKKHWWQ
jgi:TonB family protein